VFVIPSDHSVREVHGIVSAGGDPCGTVMEWTEATDILGSFGLTLP